MRYSDSLTKLYVQRKEETIYNKPLGIMWEKYFNNVYQLYLEIIPSEHIKIITQGAHSATKRRNI